MMINLKHRKPFIQLIFLITLVAFSQTTVHAATTQNPSLINYEVNVSATEGGSLYFDYGENMHFFLSDDYQQYNPSCKIDSPSVFKFSKLFQRNLIPVAQENYYFSGFYDLDNHPIRLSKAVIDVLRVSVNGIYYYDYYAAYENPKYAKYTPSAYKTMVKSYLKTLYGTSRYKKMDTITIYNLPKSDGTYIAKFQEKGLPDICWSTSVTKKVGDKKFHYIPNSSSKYIYTFKSSNKKIATIDNKSGLTIIKGPGIATITCNIKETDMTLPSKYTSKLIINPISVSSVQAVQSKKTLQIKWNGKTNNSGYEIQVSNNTSFKTILASKNIKSGKSNATTIKLKTELYNNYVRIRAYKSSKGEKLYSPYVVKKIER